MQPFLRGLLGVSLVLAFTSALADECTLTCWQRENNCLDQGFGFDNCFGFYQTCLKGCDLDVSIMPPQPPPLAAYGFQGVLYGTVARWEGSYNNTNSRRRTLHLSWTPPDLNNPTVGSGPQNGSMYLSYGWRFELDPHEHQKVAVDFGPREPGEMKGRVYVWWEWEDGRKFGWVEMIDFFGHGVPPPPPGAGSTSGQQGGAESFPPWLFATGMTLPTLSGARP